MALVESFFLRLSSYFDRVSLTPKTELSVTEKGNRFSPLDFPTVSDFKVLIIKLIDRVKSLLKRNGNNSQANDQFWFMSPRRETKIVSRKIFTFNCMPANTSAAASN